MATWAHQTLLTIVTNNINCTNMNHMDHFVKFIKEPFATPLGPSRGGGNAAGGGTDLGLDLKSTCHLALNECERDATCNRYLDQVKKMCDPLTCDRTKCMRAIRDFYRNIPERHSTDIAFCICK